MTMRTLTCGEFEHGLVDHLDGSASAAVRASMDAHAAACDDCAALLAGVSSLVAEARALPELVPSRDLWQGIESRIAAPVLALDTAARRGSASTPRRASWMRMGAAAAALVLATAGITYTATRSMLDAGAPSAVAETPAPSDGTDSLRPAGSTGRPAIAGPATVAAGGGTPDAGRPSGAPARFGDAAATPVATPAAARPLLAGEATFDAEIGELRSVLERRRTELDPATVAILEHNLGVIDQAIDQSRAALVRDPANQFLTEQLNSTLGKKVELLRTAAMLPARL
jgi:hypothetical protein